nr:hypothetical protein [uncultured Pseudodesulfovibrio sp.]
MTLDIYEDSLYGQVLPSNWDGDIISGVLILVDGEEQFIVEHDENAKGLTAHIEKWVTVTGTIMENDDELRIKVINYTLENDLDYISDDDW